MCGSKKKQETTQTASPTNPQFSTNLVQGIAENASGLMKNYGAENFYAPRNEMQNQAAQGLQGLTAPQGLGQGAYDEALVSLRNITNGRGDFESPYATQVRQTALTDYDVNADNQRAAAALRQAGANAFQGSGAAIENAQLGGELARGRASLDANLLDQGFNTAANLGLQAQGQKMNAAQLIAQLGLANDQSSQNQQGIDLQRLLQQYSMGEDMRQTDQERMQGPIDLLERFAGVANGTPLGLFQGQTQTGTSTAKGGNGIFGTLGTLAQGAGALGWSPFG